MWWSFLAAINKYRVISVVNTVPGLKVLRMEPLEGKMPAFLPGQFAFLHILDKNGSSIVKRPYSIASSPSAPYLEFCIRMVHGEMTSKLETAKPGTVIGVEGPFGAFSYTGQKKAAFIAGGCGVAPMMSMLRQIGEKSTGGQFILFYSARTREELAYKKELEELQKGNPGIRVVITLTREEAPGYACGRINDQIIKMHAGDPKEFDWWMCGSKEMVLGLKGCLAGMGVEVKKIRIEGWG